MCVESITGTRATDVSKECRYFQFRNGDFFERCDRSATETRLGGRKLHFAKPMILMRFRMKGHSALCVSRLAYGQDRPVRLVRPIMEMVSLLILQVCSYIC